MNVLNNTLSAAALISCLSSPAWANDILVGGNHCNTFCQSWLGLSATPDAHPADPIRTVSPVLRERVTEPVVLERPARQMAAPTLASRPEPIQQQAALEDDFDSDVLPQSANRNGEQPRKPRASLPTRAVKSSASDVDMAPGLKGLPKLSELVAVRGTIMIESPNERALGEKLRAQLLRSTTRPKAAADTLSSGK